MDSVALLNKYPIALFHDKQAFQVLAFLYKNRSANYEELAGELNASTSQAADVVRRLFKSGWITPSVQSYFFLSNRSELLMNFTGMNDLAAKSLWLELVPSDEEVEDLVWSERPGARETWNVFLLHLQVARWTNEVFEHANESVWKRVLRLIQHSISGRFDVEEQSKTSKTYGFDMVWNRQGESDLIQCKSFVANHILPSDRATQQVVLLFGLNNVVAGACYGSFLMDTNALISFSEVLGGRVEGWRFEWEKFKDLIARCKPTNKEWLNNLTPDDITRELCEPSHFGVHKNFSDDIQAEVQAWLTNRSSE